MDLALILNKKLDRPFLIQLFQEQKEVHEHAIKLAITNKQPQAWRAAWILKHCTQKNDLRILPHISKIIDAIPNKKEGQQRELLKILEKMDLDDEQEGKLFDICMNLWENIVHSPSLRHTSFLFIYKTCQKYSDLKEELNYITEQHYLETLSPGIKKVIHKLMAQIK